MSRSVITIERFLCAECDDVVLAPAHKRRKPTCEGCGGPLLKVASRGPAMGRGGRPPIEDPQSVTLGVRVTQDVAEQIDLFRGDESRSTWLRNAITETLTAHQELGLDISLPMDS